MNDYISYEQPLTETMRICLRLEHLFQQIDYQFLHSSSQSTRYIMNLFNHLLQLLDRADLKIKLSKEIQHCLQTLTLYSIDPHTSLACQTDLIQQLPLIMKQLIDFSGKIAQILRRTELFNMLRLHLASPGGDSSFNIPLYHYWLEQVSAREKAIQEWMSEFTSIKTAVSSILRCVRHSVKTEEKMASAGFYQELLAGEKNLRMVRISLGKHIHAYPEISIGRHFLSIRFLIPDIYKKPSQCTESLPFFLDYYSLT